MEERMQSLTLYMRGWINYFGIANQYQRTVDLDHWIRRRLRMCYWKQWRKPRTRIRHLLKQGVPLKLAIHCGISSKSYWHSAKNGRHPLGVKQRLSGQTRILFASEPMGGNSLRVMKRPVRTRTLGVVGTGG